MKTIKIIDLLNKIANGEEVPKKIKYESRILYLEDEATFNYYDKDGENALFNGWIGQYLNDEVEILEETLEEKKIPEKIDVLVEVMSSDKIGALTNEIGEIQRRFNQLIDYLKSKGDE